MGDAERLQIGHDGRGRVEIEIRRELQAVGRDRECWTASACYPMRQNTDQGGMASPVNSPPQIRVPVGLAGAMRDVLVRQVGQQPQRRAVAHAPVRR